MRAKLKLLAVAAPLALSPCAFGAGAQVLRGSVFKIQISSNEPSFTDPWKRLPAGSSSGTGFYIGEPGILTNAHVVANASFITVLRDGDSRPVPATVKFIAHDADLALLEVADDAVLKHVVPMRFGTLPKLRSPVTTIGFPTGGEQLSITAGIVSRISYRRYVHHGSARHLLVQVDSAINPGNSGGPVVQGREVVGVAFQSFTAAENTGYIIPTPVIRHFLKDVEDGRYDGHPDDGLTTMESAMTNPSTAAFHGLSLDDGGVKVAHVAEWAPTAKALEAGDILLAIDGQPIGVDGKVNFQGERVDFRTVFDLKLVGEQAVFKVARGGAVLPVTVQVKASLPHPVPEYVYARRPRYFVWGGLVFTTLTRSWLRTWGERWFRDAPLAVRFFDAYSRFEPTTHDAREIVVLAKRLPDAVNAYATGNVSGIVSKIDGRAVKKLEDLVDGLEGPTRDGKTPTGDEEFAVIGFQGSEDPLVLSRPAVAARNGAINKTYGVTPDRWLKGAEEDGAVRREVTD